MLLNTLQYMKQPPTANDYLAPNDNCVEAEKPCCCRGGTHGINSYVMWGVCKSRCKYKVSEQVCVCGREGTLGKACWK